MIDRPSAFIVKLEPSSKLNEIVVFFAKVIDFPISVPSISTLTSPWSLQLPNLSFALPFDQNVVEIIEVENACTSKLDPLEPSKSFRLHCFPRNTNRFSTSILSRSQPFSFIDPWDVKSAMPSSAQATVGPKRKSTAIAHFIYYGLFYVINRLIARCEIFLLTSLT